MAYQAKRKKIFEEEFQLTDEDGTVVHTIRVALDADNIVKSLSEKHMALVRALNDVQKFQDASTDKEQLNGIEVLGNAVIDILESVFGEEDTECIVGFYNNRYIEMCQEVVPFITGVVIPQIRRISQENKKELISKYNRKQHRGMIFRKK